MRVEVVDTDSEKKSGLVEALAHSTSSQESQEDGWKSVGKDEGYESLLKCQ